MELERNLEYTQIKLGEEQLEALDVIKDFINNKHKQVFSLVGAAGTGKTLLCSIIIKYLEKAGIDFCLCAPTHKAKTVIEHYTGCPAITLHKLLSLSPKLDIINLDFRELEFQMGEASKQIPYKGLVICDEASMISDDLYKLLLKTCKKERAKILFVSDKAQLKPVDSTRVSLVYSVPDSYTLTKIYRQTSKNSLMPILQTLREDKIDHFEESIGDEGSLFCESNFAEFFNSCKMGIMRAIEKSDIFETKILAYTNDRVKKYNDYLTKVIFGDSQKFHKLEILTGYENLTFNGYEFWNSMDYIIVSNPKEIDIYIPEYISLPGYYIELYDEGNKQVSCINILNDTIDNSYLKGLAEYIEYTRLEAIESVGRSRKLAWRKYYSIYNSFTTPVNLYYDNRLIRKKSFDKGYAITVHKSQGSSFNNVYVDMSDIQECKDLETRRQLQYVSLSRTRKDAYIFQR